MNASVEPPTTVPLTTCAVVSAAVALLSPGPIAPFASGGNLVAPPIASSVHAEESQASPESDGGTASRSLGGCGGGGGGGGGGWGGGGGEGGGGGGEGTSLNRLGHPLYRRSVETRWCARTGAWVRGVGSARWRRGRHPDCGRDRPHAIGTQPRERPTRHEHHPASSRRVTVPT